MIMLHINYNYLMDHSKAQQNNSFMSGFNRDKEQSFDSSTWDMSEYLLNVKDENYKKYLKEKYDLIMKTFLDIDKDNSGYLEYHEVIDYLDKHMPVMIYKSREKRNQGHGPGHRIFHRGVPQVQDGEPDGKD